MADKIIENNQVSVMGRIATGFTFSHQVFGEGILHDGYPGKTSQRFGGQDPGDGV